MPPGPHSRHSLIRSSVLGVLGVILGVGALGGCSGFSTEEEPLPDSTFARVLTDLHIASMRTSVDIPTPPHLRDSVFTHHGVRASEFEASLRQYSRHPDRFETLYQTVIDTLQALRYPSQRRSAPEKRPDSLRSAPPDQDKAP